MLRLGQCLVLDLADHRLAGLGHRQPGDALELDQLSLSQLVQPRGLDFEALGSGVQRHRLLLERGRLTIERLLPIQESALGALVGGALLARLFLGCATQVQGLVLSLEDDLLLLRARLGLEALGVALGMLDRVGGDEATRHEADEHPDDGGDGRHGDDSEFGHSAPPRRWSPGWAMVAPARRAIDRNESVRPIPAGKRECSAKPRMPLDGGPGAVSR